MDIYTQNIRKLKQGVRENIRKSYGKYINDIIFLNSNDDSKETNVVRHS